MAASGNGTGRQEAADPREHPSPLAPEETSPKTRHSVVRFRRAPYSRLANNLANASQGSTVDRFLMIEAFVRVAETRSFAQAARQIGVSNSVASARVQALESFVNAPLFHRNTRRVRLSEIGESFYRGSAELVTRLMHLTDHMRGLRQEPAGR